MGEKVLFEKYIITMPLKPIADGPCLNGSAEIYDRLKTAKIASLRMVVGVEALVRPEEVSGFEAFLKSQGLKFVKEKS